MDRFFEPLESRILASIAPGPHVDEIGFQQYIVAGLPPGAGASVAAGTTTDISSAVTINNYTPAGRTPYGADYRDNSEFMAGDVYVNVVLLESNGVIDASTENWTSSQIGQVKSEVMEGLNWWETTFHTQNPNSKSNLRFFVDFTNADTPVQTRYEPIKHKYSEYALWVDDFLDTKGSNTTSSTIDDMRRYNNLVRNAKGTDWSFTIFIAHSLADTDGKFADGYFAYSYFGGPFLTMTYDNSGWGISRMGQVLAHETGHTFYALDEYAGSGTAGYYTNTSGYYNIQNLNAADQRPAGAPARVASMMAEASLQNVAYPAYTSSPTSLQMLGWRDTDNDGVFDVLDVPFTLAGSGSYDAASTTFTFTGSSSVGTLPNLNQYGSRNAVTTNTIDALQYNVDNIGWVTASSYSMYSGTVAANVNVASFGGGSHTIAFRTTDLTTGVASNTWSSSFDGTGDVLPPPPPPPPPPSNPASLVLSLSKSMQTSESGTIARFKVSLAVAPTADVVVAISSSDTTEGSLVNTRLTFTASNWSTPQTVTMRGIDDKLVDGDIAYYASVWVLSSADARYAALPTYRVDFINKDNEAPALVSGGGNAGLIAAIDAVTRRGPAVSKLFEMGLVQMKGVDEHSGE